MNIRADIRQRREAAHPGPRTSASAFGARLRLGIACAVLNQARSEAVAQFLRSRGATPDGAGR